MSFAFPLGLLGLIAVPVLIAIYIIKNKYTEQVVTSTYIWTLSEKFLKRRNPINKLTGIISLILQLLAVILISFAAAQPSFTLTGAARDYYFILDGSGSMSIVQSGKTRLDLGKEKISEIIGDAVKGSRYSLVYVGDGAQLIFEDVDDKDRALAYVEELAPVCTSADVSEAVSFAQSYFEKTPTAQTYLITDTDYEVAENVTVVNVATSAVNYALYDVGYAVVADAQAGAYSLVVSGYAVSYTGDASLPVSVYFDDGAQAAASTVLEVAENVPAQFSFKFSQTDFRTAKVVLGKSDDLSLDNTCILYNLSDENSFSVLYVTDGDADEPSFMDFLLAAYGGADVEKVTASSYKAATGYDLYIFDGYSPAVLPSDGAIWFFNPQESVAKSGFSVQNEVSLTVHGELSYSTSSASMVTKLTNNLVGNTVSVIKYQKLGLYRSFTTLLTFEGNPMVFAGTNEYGNRQVVYAFDLNDSDFPVKADFYTLNANLLAYLFPQVVEQTLYECGEKLQLNVVSGCDSLRVDSPSGTVTYLDTSGELTEMTLTEVGTYTVTMTGGRTSQVYSVYVTLPVAEGVPLTETGAYYGFAGEPSTAYRDGVYDELLILFIILAVVVVADWAVYCYEQYQLR